MTHSIVLNAAAAGVHARRRTRLEKLVTWCARVRTCCSIVSSMRTSSACCHVLGAPCGARTEQARGHVRGASLPSVSDTLGTYEG